MPCCGLCRPKVKAAIKTNKNLTTKKVHRIDTWIESIEGPYESIVLPSKSPAQPTITSNKDEIDEAQRNNHLDDVSMSTDHDKSLLSTRNMKNRKHNLQYLSSGLSINEDIQSARSK